MSGRLAGWLALAVALAGDACGQWLHLPDADAASGACDAVPFGGGSGFWTNQRFQTVIAASELGARPGLLLGLGLAACGTGQHRHARLRILCAPMAPGFSFAGQTDFAANLAAARAPAVVLLDATDFSWWSVQDRWSSVGLQRGFAWNGVDDLLLDVLAEGNAFVDATAGTAGMHQAPGRPRLWFASSTALPPPPLRGRVDLAGPRLRLGFGVGDAAQQATGCHGARLLLAGEPKVGNALQFTARGGFDSAPVLLLFGAPTGFAPTELLGFGLPGCFLYQPPTLALASVADAVGEAVFPFALPLDPGLLAARARLQALLYDRSPALRASSDSWVLVVGR